MTAHKRVAESRDTQFRKPLYGCYACHDSGLLVNSDGLVNDFLADYDHTPEGRRSGGPKLRELLWSRLIVEECFAGLQVLELLEGTVFLDEGPRHQGHAEVVRALLRKE